MMHALSSPLTGTEREVAFISFLKPGHSVDYAKVGDFIVDGRYLFEIGGKGKKFDQIRDIPDSFLVVDNLAVGFENKIPLWLFGFVK